MGQEMIERDVNVTGRSGAIPSFAVCPDGPEAFPGIILYMDAPGIREELRTWRGASPNTAIFACCPTCTTESAHSALTSCRRAEGIAKAWESGAEASTAHSIVRVKRWAAGNLLEGNVHVIDPHGSKRDPITHQGETLGFILEGQLELTIETTTYRLSEGDSFFFKNHLTNTYRNLSSGITRILWVNTPQVH